LTYDQSPVGRNTVLVVQQCLWSSSACGATQGLSETREQWDLTVQYHISITTNQVVPYCHSSRWYLSKCINCQCLPMRTTEYRRYRASIRIRIQY